MRNKYTDLVKGYAIILVVFGHALQTFLPDWQSDGIVLLIYSFHMPLFMFISGYFHLQSVDKRKYWDFLKLKFRSIMVPSLTIGIINAIIIGGGNSLVHNQLRLRYIIELFSTGLWFLTVLFVLSVIGGTLRKLFKERIWLAWGSVLIILYFIPEWWIVNELKYLSLFFVLGCFFSKLKLKSIPVWVGICSIVCYVLLFQNMDFSKTVYQMTNQIFSKQYFYDYFFRDTIAFLGIISSMFLCQILNRLRLISKILVYLGSITLPIYVLHQYLFMWNSFAKIQINSSVIIFCIAVLALWVTYLLYRILSINTVIDRLLFGNVANR